VCVMLTGVGGEKCSGGQGHVVCGCCNVCVSSVGVGEGVVYKRFYGRGVLGCVAGEWVQVLMEKRWYLPRCCGCGPKEPVCSVVHCV